MNREQSKPEIDDDNLAMNISGKLFILMAAGVVLGNVVDAVKGKIKKVLDRKN